MTSLILLLTWFHIDGLVQDCSISSALAMEIQQSCTKPSICTGTTENYVINMAAISSRQLLINLQEFKHKTFPVRAYTLNFKIRCMMSDHNYYKISSLLSWLDWQFIHFMADRRQCVILIVTATTCDISGINHIHVHVIHIITQVWSHSSNLHQCEFRFISTTF